MNGSRKNHVEGPILEVIDLKKSFSVPGSLFRQRKVEIIDGISFTISPGETLGCVAHPSSCFHRFESQRGGSNSRRIVRPIPDRDVRIAPETHPETTCVGGGVAETQCGWKSAPMIAASSVDSSSGRHVVATVGLLRVPRAASTLAALALPLPWASIGSSLCD